MPIKNCTKNGKKGKKWGDNGTCYIGKDSTVRAAKQGLAVITSGYKAQPGEKERLLGIISKSKGRKKGN